VNRYIAALILVVFTAGTAAAAGVELKLSLKEAIRLAIEKNLDLKAELYSPAQAEADIRKNRAIYETHLTVDGGYRESTTYSSLSGSGIEQSTLFLTPGAYKLLPTGGTLNLNYQNIQQKNNTPTALGSYWTSALELSLNQPLLKNFGRENTELNIKVSEFSKETSVSHLKSRILATISQVSIEYFKLVSFLQDMESKKISLELAKKVLTETDARVKAGVTPAMEILNAQFGVSLREKDMIDAEKSVNDQADVLRLLLQIDRVTDIAPVDTPSRVQIALNEDDAIKKSLAARPDLEELKVQLATLELQSSVARSQTLPSLNFTSSIGFTGLDAAYGRATERLGSLEYPVWSVGLQFDYPLGNQSAENDYIKSRLKSEQAQLQLESLKAAIAAEVRTAIRTVQSSYKQLDVSDRARLYADERFNAYQKKSEVGLATNKDLLDVENDLATARSSQIKAQVAYATALIQLWKSTGELLEREGITVDSSRSDKLYREMK
jgi:outer membrane protein TolC